jgi:hypothetical protein
MNAADGSAWLGLGLAVSTGASRASVRRALSPHCCPSLPRSRRPPSRSEGVLRRPSRVVSDPSADAHERPAIPVARAWPPRAVARGGCPGRLPLVLSITGARGRSGRCGRPLCWPTDCARRRSPDRCRVLHRPAIRASRRRELDRCCRPCLAVISTERSDAVDSGVSVIGGRGGSLADLGGRLVWRSPRDYNWSGPGVSAPAARWCRHQLAGAATRFTAVARRGGFGGAPAGGGRRSGRST